MMKGYNVVVGVQEVNGGGSQLEGVGALNDIDTQHGQIIEVVE